MNFFFQQRKLMNFAMHLTEFCLFTTVLLHTNLAILIGINQISSKILNIFQILLDFDLLKLYM